MYLSTLCYMEMQIANWESCLHKHNGLKHYTCVHARVRLYCYITNTCIHLCMRYWPYVLLYFHPRVSWVLGPSNSCGLCYIIFIMYMLHCYTIGYHHVIMDMVQLCYEANPSPNLHEGNCLHSGLCGLLLFITILATGVTYFKYSKFLFWFLRGLTLTGSNPGGQIFLCYTFIIIIMYMVHLYHHIRITHTLWVLWYMYQSKPKCLNPNIQIIILTTPTVIVWIVHMEDAARATHHAAFTMSMPLRSRSLLL